MEKSLHVELQIDPYWVKTVKRVLSKIGCGGWKEEGEDRAGLEAGTVYFHWFRSASSETPGAALANQTSEPLRASSP